MFHHFSFLVRFSSFLRRKENCWHSVKVKIVIPLILSGRKIFMIRVFRYDNVLSKGVAAPKQNLMRLRMSLSTLWKPACSHIFTFLTDLASISTTSTLFLSGEVYLITFSENGIFLSIGFFPPVLCDFLNLLPAEVRSSEVMQ